MAARSETGGVKGRAAGGAAGGALWLDWAWRYGPVVAWIAVILYSSTGKMSSARTSRVLGPFVRWLLPAVSEEALFVLHVIARKGGHLVGYAVLALLAARAFLASPGEFLSRRWIASALTLVACVALADEYNQSLYVSRRGTIWDSLLDCAGGATALAALSFWLGRRRAAGAGKSEGLIKHEA